MAYVEGCFGVEMACWDPEIEPEFLYDTETGTCTDDDGVTGTNPWPIHMVRETGDGECADLSHAMLNEEDYAYPSLEEWNLQGAVLKQANASRANFQGATFYRALCAGGIFYEADFSNADLSGADFKNADLRNANLSGANLLEARVSGTDFSGANLDGAQLFRCLDSSKTIWPIGYSRPGR